MLELSYFSFLMTRSLSAVEINLKYVSNIETSFINRKNSHKIFINDVMVIWRCFQYYFYKVYFKIFYILKIFNIQLLYITKTFSS